MRSSHRNINEFWYNLPWTSISECECVSLSWFVNDLFPHSHSENCEVKCKTLILLVSRSIDWSWLIAVEPKRRKRVKVKIKSTYRISNCQHQAECGSHVVYVGSPTEDHAGGSSVICFLKWSVRSGALSFFICLFDIVFFFVSNRGIHHNFLLIDTYNKRWQRPSIVSSIVIRYSLRLFVLSFIQAFNCQATKCKQISSRSSSNNHKSLQPFSRYWSWNMQHATWKHDRDCRVPQVPPGTPGRHSCAPKMSSHSNCRIDLSTE